jgi:hypothetical protein
MPVHSFAFQVQPPDQPTPPVRPFPEGLLHCGPVLGVQIEIPSALAAAFQAQGQPPPAPATGFALIDTDATRSGVDVSVVTSLGIQPIGVASVGTASGIVQRPVYSAKFSFPGTNLPPVEFAQLLGVDLTGQTVVMLNQKLVALIGRDILRRFVMIYNGLEGHITLAF